VKHKFKQIAFFGVLFACCGYQAFRLARYHASGGIITPLPTIPLVLAIALTALAIRNRVSKSQARIGTPSFEGSTKEPNAHSGELAFIQVKRRSSFMGALVDLQLYLDGTLQGGIRNGRFRNFFVSPGVHSLAVSMDGMGHAPDYRFECKPRQRLILECGPRYRGMKSILNLASPILWPWNTWSINRVELRWNGNTMRQKKFLSNHGLESTGAPPAAQAPETHP